MNSDAEMALDPWAGTRPGALAARADPTTHVGRVGGERGDSFDEVVFQGVAEQGSVVEEGASGGRAVSARVA